MITLPPDFLDKTFVGMQLTIQSDPEKLLIIEKVKLPAIIKHKVPPRRFSKKCNKGKHS